MAKYYAGRIRRGKMTLDDVPQRWRDATAALIAPKQQA
ncbi:CD1375 family protein [Adlercreutzia sp. ZJ141]|nr:CD1375 family protein [Adlercreutzia sp. ZJ141]